MVNSRSAVISSPSTYQRSAWLVSPEMRPPADSDALAELTSEQRTRLFQEAPQPSAPARNRGVHRTAPQVVGVMIGPC